MIAQLKCDIRNLACYAAAAIVLSGCGSSPAKYSGAHRNVPRPYTVQSSEPTVAEQAVSIAVQQVGVPYRYGGQAPTGFDCSGLVHYSYLRAGKPVPRTTAQLWKNTETVSRSELMEGDLLFFSINGKMQHVGMYIGEDQFVHAPSSGRHVQVASLESDFYSDALLRGGRLR